MHDQKSTFERQLLKFEYVFHFAIELDRFTMEESQRAAYVQRNVRGYRGDLVCYTRPFRKASGSFRQWHYRIHL